jgi:hypothetical protein
MTQKQRTTRIPTPVYAVAGVGDIAYRQLRELREEIPSRVAGLRTEIAEIPARVERARAEVPATVNSLVDGAFEVYGTLVRRGEKAIGRRRTVTAAVSTHTAPSTTAKKTAAKAPAKRATTAKAATKATTRATTTPTKATRATKATKRTSAR